MKRFSALVFFVLISPAAPSQGLPAGCDSEQVQVLANNIQAQAICDYLVPQTKEARAAHLQSLASASPTCYQMIMSDMTDQISAFDESVPTKLDELPAPVKEWYLGVCADPAKLDAFGAPGDGR